MNNTYILFEYKGLVNGSMLDCIDLFLWCHRHDININLGIVSEKYNEFIKYVELLYHERYNEYLKESYFDDILHSNIHHMRCVDIPKLVRKCIIFDLTTWRNNKIFLKMVDKVCMVSNFLPFDFSNGEDGFFSMLSEFENNPLILYESAYGFLGNMKYRQKYLLDGLKSCYNPEKLRTPIIICPNVEEDDFWKYMYSGLWKNTRYNRNAFDYVYRCNSSYIPNLINRINEVMYFESPNIYDRKPRIMLEAQYLGIPISYHISIKNSSDGSTMRYFNMKNELDDRIYTYEDILIKWICR